LKVNAGIAMTTGACSNLFINQIVRNGSENQKEALLPDHVAGKLIGGLAMTEPNAGSDVMSMKTSAVKKGDFYVINGNKFWITNGPVADHIVLYAKTNPSRNGLIILA
jgi:isovaleryl-CoA dehydrogenase